MKTLRKNLLLLAFAAGAMLLIGNNLSVGSPGGEKELPAYGVWRCYTTLIRPGNQILHSCNPCYQHILVTPAPEAKQNHC